MSLRALTDSLARSLSPFLKNLSELIVIFSRSNVDMTTKTLPELAGDFRITVRAVSFSNAIPAQNQTIPTFFSNRNPRQSKIKAAVIDAIKICLEKILETFGLLDFAVLVMPLIIAVLSYRHDEQGDDAEVGADDLSTEANEVSLLQCFRNILTEDWLSVQS